ncbi:MAG: hypothetical protein HY272_01960 [Gammaproteobacteria bacterium]|nr:hypothetical protein [Gammaproteobacteria bacterium]
MKMNMHHSGFCGEKSYEPGIVDVNHDHARMVFLHGHGCPVNEADEALSFDDACALFRLQPAEIVIATVNHAPQEA